MKLTSTVMNIYQNLWLEEWYYPSSAFQDDGLIVVRCLVVWLWLYLVSHSSPFPGGEEGDE